MEGDSGVASCGFLKPKWNRNREAERSYGHRKRVLFFSLGNAPADNMPTQFAQCLLERSPLQTAPHEQVGCLDEIGAGLFFGSALGG